MLYPLRSGWPQILSWNKETLCSGEKRSLQLNTVNYKEKMLLGTTTLDHNPFLWAAISLKFLQFVNNCSSN